MTKRITHIAKPLLPATLTLSALMSMAACGGSSGKPAAAAAGTSAATAVTASGTSQPGGAPSASTAGQTSAQGQSQTQTQNQAQAPTQTTQAQAPAAAPSTTQAADPAPKPSTANAGANNNDGSSLPGDCAVDHLKGTVSSLNKPINHVLLTVTNTGGTTCNLYYYPALRFDADQQSVTQAVEDSKPQAVVTIAPGESAYAAIGTSAADGSGGTPKEEKQVEVFLETRDQSGSLPGSMTLPLPAGTYVDIDKAFVTYWQSDMQSALAW